MALDTVGEITYICGNSNANETKPVIYVATTAEVSSIPAAANGVVSTAITMESGKKFKIWELAKAPGKNSYKFEGVGDIDSNLTKHTYVAVINKITATRLQNSKGGCNYVMIFADNNGQKWIMGDKVNGCTMIRNGEIAGTNAITVTFEWYTGQDVDEYTSTIPVT